ncbi:hypothetical protein AX16_007167 [Volvariella volvacea WC 439]|nr:hypothetical protein AX16_007167 [Volvariella volvacea WC 439]
MTINVRCTSLAENFLSIHIPRLQHLHVKSLIPWKESKALLCHNNHLSSIAITPWWPEDRCLPRELGPICDFPNLDTLHIIPKYGCAFFALLSQHALPHGVHRQLKRCTLDFTDHPNKLEDVVLILGALLARRLLSPNGQLELICLSQQIVDEVERWSQMFSYQPRRTDQLHPPFSHIHNLVITATFGLGTSPLLLLKKFCSLFPDLREFHLKWWSQDFVAFDSFWPEAIQVCPLLEKGVVEWPGTEYRQVYPMGNDDMPARDSSST